MPKQLNIVGQGCHIYPVCKYFLSQVRCPAYLIFIRYKAHCCKEDAGAKSQYFAFLNSEHSKSDIFIKCVVRLFVPV